MDNKRKQTVFFANAPVITAAAGVAGPKEGHGPLGKCFDRFAADSRFGQKTWEAAESALLRSGCNMALEKAGLAPEDLDFILCGDLLNQCTATSYAMRSFNAPLLGLYSACASFGEALGIGAMLVNGGSARQVMAAASSHFCAAERQFRNPLPYGSQRTPTAQWTVTAAGAAILSAEGNGPRITCYTPGQVCDGGVKDMSNMGAAMAPAAYATLTTHFADTGRSPDDYDAIVTGDLGAVGSELLQKLLSADGIVPGAKLMDCGRMIYARKSQDAHAGGSGAGCCAAVFCCHLLHQMEKKRWTRLLFAPTGALMSPTVNQQGESIPAICHAVTIETERI